MASPHTVTSDRGPQFVSSLWCYLSHFLNTSYINTTAFHPLSYGLLNDCIAGSKTPSLPAATLMQRWAKVTTLRALTIFLEALLQLEKRLGRWTGA
jgi:hypothetical protein